MPDQLRELTRDDPEFYPTLGPYLANRDVARFVGDNIWDDESKTWYVLTGARGLRGFCAVTAHGRGQRGRWVVESLYLTDPEDHTAAERLIAAAVKAFGRERHLHATVRHEHTYAYEKAGFTAAGETRNFTKLIRPATITQDKDATHV